MNSFKISRFTQNLSQAIKLKHVLHFYEELETSLHVELIEKTHAKFKNLISEDDYITLLAIVDSNFDISESLRDALARFCIRQL